MPGVPVFRHLFASFLVALGFLCTGTHAQSLQPVPSLTAHAIDSTGTLDAAQLKALDDKLAAFEQSSGSQLVVLMISTTQPEDIASFANRVGNDWKIGRKDVGDGVLLLVAKTDRKVRIEVAKALEGAVPDLAAKQVIDEAITPRFKTGDFAGGLDAGVEQLMARIRGESLPAPPQRASNDGNSDGFGWTDLAILLFIAVPIAASVARRLLGPKVGAFSMTGVVFVVAYIVTTSLVIAVLAGLAAFVITLFSVNIPTGGRGRGSWGSAAVAAGAVGAEAAAGSAPAAAVTSVAVAPRATGRTIWELFSRPCNACCAIAGSMATTASARFLRRCSSG